MANRFSVAPPSLQGLGQIAQAFGQKSMQNQAEEKQATQLEQQKASISESYRLMRQGDFAGAYKENPEFAQGAANYMKTRGETEKLSQPAKEMTPYQVERIKIDQKSLELREREDEARQEANANKRKSLELKVKKERIKLDELERQVAADNKGGEVQKMLRNASESSKKASSFARRMTDAGAALDKLEQTIDPTSRVIGYISGGTGISSEAANRMASPEEQAYAAAASDFVTGQLRQESGAAIGQDEFDRKYREFFPMPGDNKEQIKLKRNRRNAASIDMKNLSGGLYEALYGESAQAQPVAPAQPTATQQAQQELSPSAMKYLGGQ